MNKSRLNILLDYLNEEPNDPFNIYAIAIEYLSTNSQESGKYFDLLLEKHPDYLPTYYHAAKYYATKNKEQAEKIFKNGIQLAQIQGNNNALRELKNAYNEFLYDDEED